MKTFIFKITFAIYSLIFIGGCSNSTEEIKQENPEIETKSKQSGEGRIVYEFGWHQHIKVYEVDSCEYIGFSGMSEGGTSIIHKQNCKFCAQRNKSKECQHTYTQPQ